MDEASPLPTGSVLVHIGPYKTGTTAIQTSLHLHRDDMLRHGVLYPGKRHRHFREGWALTGKSPRGVEDVPRAEWEALVKEVDASTATRVCISSEDFARADKNAINELVGAFGDDRVHVLMVVRRLDKLLPSAWQQRVKSSNEFRTYDQWLREVLAEETPTSGPGNVFWGNHGVARVLDRWLTAVPADHVALLMADESDRSQQMRTFERLLDLPDRLLTPGPRDNTSLSLSRIELYRQVNKVFEDRGWDDRHRRRLIHGGLLTGLRNAPSSDSDLAIPPLPKWAAERVADLSDARVHEVLESGAVVIGDPDRLRFDMTEHPEDVGEQPRTIAIETAAMAVETLVDAALKAEKSASVAGARQRRRRKRDLPTLANASGRQLLRELMRRARRRIAR